MKKKVDFNLICVSNAGFIMTLVFASWKDLAAGKKKAKKLGYRDFNTSVGFTVNCTPKDTEETLRFYNTNACLEDAA